MRGLRRVGKRRGSLGDYKEMKLKCLRCGREFEGASTAIHCPECVDIIKHTHYRPRICKACGASFMGGTSALYCPDCRVERKKKQKLEYEARKRAGNVRKIGSIDNCVICGKPYKERRAKYSREKRIREKEAKEKANSGEGTSPPMGRGDTERG